MSFFNDLGIALGVLLFIGSLALLILYIFGLFL